MSNHFSNACYSKICNQSSFRGTIDESLTRSVLKIVFCKKHFIEHELVYNQLCIYPPASTFTSHFKFQIPSCRSR